MTLNCDLGESYGPWTKGDDAAVMPLIDWANIACGGHAGDSDTMARTLDLAAEHDVRAGAHPGYPDRRNFGRVKLDVPVESLVHEIQTQIGSLQALAVVRGIKLNHVKPHGALYNAMMADFGLLVRLAQAVAAVDPSLIFVLQATPNRSQHELALRHTGLKLAFEAFADRRYNAAGLLRPRSESGAVITDPAGVTAHVGHLLAGTVETPEGMLPISFDTLCVHGDTPGAASLLRAVRERISPDA